uniref:ENTH domain-containing protein n=1 Tax=Mesocestoides corti TaxID=53468 RepID=A0A5K3F6K5_MESCO
MAGRAVRRLAGNGTGQSLVDRMTSMKHSISGSLIAKTICKATTEEMNAPKRKHLNSNFSLFLTHFVVLVNCTYEPRLSMPEFANYIISRSHNSSWVVSFKALITIHHLMNCGSERFSQYLASNNCHLAAPRPFERSNSQAVTMLVFIRQYARYLDSRSSSYREVAFDFCKIKRKADEVNMKTMPQAKLFKVLPPLERQIDALIAFDASSSELLNGVVLAAYFLLYKDLIRLYAVYNEGMINIIEKFFSMSKKDCQEALRIYKAFLKRMEQVNQFVKVAEACDSLQMDDGFGKQSLIFKPVPASVLDALEQHLAHLEGKKLADPKKTSPTPSSSSQPSAVTGDLLLLQEASQQNLSVEQQRIIEEERQRLEAFVSQARSKCPGSTTERAVGGSVERSSSDGDLLELFTGCPADTGKKTDATNNTLFDDFFFEPAMPSSSSHLALSSVPVGGGSGGVSQPRPLSQFLSESTSVSNTAVPNPNNPFLPANSSPWPLEVAPSATVTPSVPCVDNGLASSASNQPNATIDLDSRLAELAGQLTVSNARGCANMGWSAGGRQFAPPQLSPPPTGPLVRPQPSTMNPWVGAGGGLQLASANNNPLSNQIP